MSFAKPRGEMLDGRPLGDNPLLMIKETLPVKLTVDRYPASPGLPE
jgi:hypothetical protein